MKLTPSVRNDQKAEIQRILFTITRTERRREEEENEENEKAREGKEKKR